MVSIDICRIKNGRDLVTYHGVSVPLYSSVLLSTLNNFVASIMLLKESVDMEN